MGREFVQRSSTADDEQLDSPRLLPSLRFWKVVFALYALLVFEISPDAVAAAVLAGWLSGLVDAWGQ